MTPRAGGAEPQGQVSAAIIDGVFRALSDPTRRDVLGRLSAHSASVSDLAATYDMALPSFVEHLKVLERSGLVRSHKAGRVRTYELVPKRLRWQRTGLRGSALFGSAASINSTAIS